MNSESYVLIGHGSPKEAGNKHLKMFVEKLKNRMAGQKFYFGALKRVSPSMEEVLNQVCREEETGTIVVMPLFLFAAAHCKVDIPAAIEAAQKKFPGKTFRLASPLGIHPFMVDIVREYVSRADEQSKNKNKDETLLLMIGRGTSDTEAIEEFKQIGQIIQSERGFKELEYCYMDVNHPDFEEGLELCARSNAKRVIAVPYLLFYGMLVDKVINGFKTLAEKHPEKEIRVTPLVGNHPNVIETLIARAQEN